MNHQFDATEGGLALVWVRSRKNPVCTCTSVCFPHHTVYKHAISFSFFTVAYWFRVSEMQLKNWWVFQLFLDCADPGLGRGNVKAHLLSSRLLTDRAPFKLTLNSMQMNNTVLLPARYPGPVNANGRWWFFPLPENEGQRLVRASAPQRVWKHFSCHSWYTG